LLRDAMALQEEVLPQGDPVKAAALSSLATLRFEHGGAEGQKEGLQLQRRALEIRTARVGSDHPEVAAEDVILAVMLLDGEHPQVDAPEAETLLRQAVATYRRVYPQGHPRMVVALRRLAEALKLQGQQAEGAPLAAEADAMEKAIGMAPDRDNSLK